MDAFSQDPKNDGMVVDDHGINNLESIGKWARFLGIVGFIGLGLMIIFAIIALANAGSQPRYYGFGYGVDLQQQLILAGIVYIVAAVIGFFPTRFLYNFGNEALAACASRNTQDLNRALDNLRSYFTFVGVLTIIGIGLGLIGFLAGIASSMSRF